MTELELLIDFHIEGKRQGPGSDNDTLKALNMINIIKHENIKVADIGCGTGAQTIKVAENINGKIIAIDLFPEFLDILNSNAKKSGISEKVETLEANMENLPFPAEEFDIIWSEGAIYNMGFKKGINYWKKFLKKGGYIALSEITWLTNTRPQEIENHWNFEYPEIGTASEKIRVLEEEGFKPTGYFFLPESSWIGSYYSPAEYRFDSFLKKYNYSDDARNIIEQEKNEISLYKKYKDYFSYGFYVAEKL